MGKEFEKWINYNWDTLSNISPHPYSNLLSEAWKAALEWVLVNCECKGDCGESLINQYQIREELRK